MHNIEYVSAIFTTDVMKIVSPLIWKYPPNIKMNAYFFFFFFDFTDRRSGTVSEGVTPENNNRYVNKLCVSKLLTLVKHRLYWN